MLCHEGNIVCRKHLHMQRKSHNKQIIQTIKPDWKHRKKLIWMHCNTQIKQIYLYCPPDSAIIGQSLV